MGVNDSDRSRSARPSLGCILLARSTFFLVIAASQSRTLRGGCVVKVAIAVDAAKFAACESSGFLPEADLIKRTSAINLKRAGARWDRTSCRART